MKIIRAVGVNDAYQKGLSVFSSEGHQEDSRVGKVLALQEPLAVEYSKPWQRVLLDPWRDSNPFFSLFESLWMLAGRNDARWLDRFIHDFSSRFAEEGGRQHGAYGFRWRTHFQGVDQLAKAISQLKENPKDRRVVIQMWDPNADLGANVKDVPCNLVALPRLTQTGLGLTIFCRSGDFIWGTTGANAVHFSILLEYLAGRTGLPMGSMTHIVNNPHVYTAVYDKLPAVAIIEKYPDTHSIGRDWECWDADLHRFMGWTDAVQVVPEAIHHPPAFSHNPWFDTTAVNMFQAHTLWKAGKAGHALEFIRDPNIGVSPDWQLAAVEWLERRIKRAEAKQAKEARN